MTRVVLAASSAETFSYYADKSTKMFALPAKTGQVCVFGYRCRRRRRVRSGRVVPMPFAGERHVFYLLAL